MLLPDGVLTVVAQAIYREDGVVRLELKTGDHVGATEAPTVASFFTQPQNVILQKQKFKDAPWVQKALSERQEAQVAKRLGGKVQPGSGSRTHYKSDVRVVGSRRVECKYTRAKSYRVTLEDLEKVVSECTTGEKPMFVIRFLDENNKTITEWAMMPIEAVE
jgi:aromatic ring-cleaving dioxygenase